MNVALSASFKKKRPQVVINLFLALAFLIAALVPFAYSASTNSENSSQVAVTRTNAGAFGFLCKEGIGFNMQPTNGWGRQFGEVPSGESGGRRFTIQEAFGKSLSFVSYYGEGEGTLFIAKKKEEAPDFVSANDEQLEAQRTMDSCLFNKITLTLAGATFWIADAFTNITQAAVSMAFNPKLVCDPGKTSNTCLDLLGIIGGESDDDEDSIIGSLTKSLYFPLIVILAALAGTTAAYQGIVKRQFRKASGSLLWIAAIVIIGAGVVSKPTMITKAPMVVSNTAASCVIGAFSGNSCDGSSTNGIDTGGEMFDGKSSSELACNSSTSATGTEFQKAMESSVNSATCQIWKSFVLNPYALASFGTTFDNLDTKDPDADGADFVNAADGVDANDFCVNLSSTRSAGQMEGRRLILNSSSNGGTVCNIAAYQMYLQTDALSGNDDYPSDPSNDERWYKLVEVTSSNGQMWANWTNSSSSSANKVFYGMLAVVISAAGNFIIIITSLWALIFYITGIMLMAFAPIFMLIGIHPGRGRKVMIGWLEQVISSVFKYVLSAAFVVVTVGIYSGILAANSNLFTNLVFVLIVTVALFIYRREFVEMLGKAEMGGQQFTNNIGEKMSKGAGIVSNETKRLASSAAGGAIGSKLAGGTIRDGAFAGTKRNLKRGTGFVANAARENDNVKNQNKQNLEKQIGKAKDKADASRQQRLTNALNNGGFVHQNGVPTPNSKGQFVPQTPPGGGRPGAPGVPAGAQGEKSKKLYNNRDAGVRKLDEINNLQDTKRSQNLEIADTNKQLTSRLENNVDYIDNEGHVSHANVMADKEFVQSIADEIKKVRPEISNEEALETANDLLEIQGNIQLSKAGVAGYNGLMKAETTTDRFNNGDNSYYDSLRDNSKIYEGTLKENNTIIKEEYSDLANIPGLQGAHGVHAPMTPSMREEIAYIEKEAIFSEKSGLSTEQQGQYSSLRALKDEDAKLSTDYAMAQESGDANAMEEINAKRRDISSEIGQFNSNVKENDPVLYSKIEEMNEVENDFKQMDSFHEAAFVGSNYGNAVSVNAKEKASNDRTIESLDTEAYQTEKEISGYNSQIENMGLDTSYSYDRDSDSVVDNSYDSSSSSSQEQYSQYSNENSYSTESPYYSDNDETPLVTNAYDDESISERNRMELEQNEQMLEGLHPGQGLSRRKIRKARKKLGEQMQEEGMLPDDGSSTAKQYGRTQSRRDVRGQGLEDGNESYGYNEQINRNAMPSSNPEPPSNPTPPSNPEPPRNPEPPKQPESPKQQPTRQPEPPKQEKSPKSPKNFGNNSSTPEQSSSSSQSGKGKMPKFGRDNKSNYDGDKKNVDEIIKKNNNGGFKGFGRNR